MEAVRGSWTDERLDSGFDRVTADIAQLREELQTQVGSLRNELRDLQRTLLQIGGGMLVSLIGLIATQL